jgi:hypothetical protein
LSVWGTGGSWRPDPPALAQEVADGPTTAAHLATALEPLLDRLPELPQAELRTLFDSLRLQVAFHPGEAAVDVEVALLPTNRRTSAEKVRRSNPCPWQELW